MRWRKCKLHVNITWVPLWDIHFQFILNFPLPSASWRIVEHGKMEKTTFSVRIFPVCNYFFAGFPPALFFRMFSCKLSFESVPIFR